MAISLFVGMLLIVEVMISGSRLCVDALSVDYYETTCPFAEMIVMNTVDEALRSDPYLAAGLLRMHFHDCFVQGCDGSVLIDSTNDNKAEKDSPANLSLRGFEIIHRAKEDVEDQCPGVVSCADIVAMAARDAVVWSGGPMYDIPKGRKDGRRSRIEDTINLPPPTLNSTALIGMFGRHGFSVQELVALSGGHTLGAARCTFFKNRLSKFDATHEADPSLDPNYAQMLARTCAAGGDNAAAPFDWTRDSFDNAYFRALQTGGGLLASDQTLFTSPQTRGAVSAYAANEVRFFQDFELAMVKMGLLDVKEGDRGEVRLDCRRVN